MHEDATSHRTHKLSAAQMFTVGCSSRSLHWLVFTMAIYFCAVKKQRKQKQQNCAYLYYEYILYC
jgi:hypothetical protein